MKRKILGPIVCLMCLVCLSPAAHAALALVQTVGGAPPGGLDYVNFDLLTPSGPNFIAGNTATSANPLGSIGVKFYPDAAAVTGSAPNLYAAPFLSGVNSTFFGNAPPFGADTSQYLTSGKVGDTNSRVELSFSSPQLYLGLLWGSVDTFNKLEFFNGAVSVGSIGGGLINAGATGDQGVLGTYYVNINSTLAFNLVVATSTEHAFEFDNVAYAAAPIPEPASVIVWSVLGLSVAGAGWWRRRKAIAE